MKASIASRLILSLTLSAGTIIAVALLLDYRISREEILERLRIDSQNTVVDVVQDLERMLRGIEGNTRFVGSIVSQRPGSEEELTRLLAETVRRHDDVFGATIALAPGQSHRREGFAPYYFKQGDGIAFADLAQGPEPYWQLPWFDDAASSGEPRWIEPYFDAGGADIYMTTYSVPVFTLDEQGRSQLYAVATADLTLAQLHRYLKRLELGKHGIGFLVSHDGLVLSSNTDAAQIQPYQDILPDADQQQFWLDMTNEAAPGVDTTRHGDCQVIAGHCIIRMTRLRHSGWVLGVIYSERDVLAQLRAYEYKVIALGLLCLAVMILVVNLVTRRITRPLTALALSADQLGEGHLDTPLPQATGNDEVARLVQSFGHMKEELKRHISDLEQATASRSRMEGELSAARDIQMAMLPQSGRASEHFDDVQLWATVESARTVGGDLFTYSLQGRQLFFAVGDVSDKGVPAALFMARCLSHLQHPGSTSPGRKLAELNNALVERNSNCMFVTLVLAVLDLDSLQLRYASAGHTPPLLLRDGHAASLLQDSGPATGLVADQSYPDNQLTLQPGDRLVVYTDGVDEAFNSAGDMFGHARLLQWLGSSAGQPLPAAGQRLIDDIGRFTDGAAQSDDITVLLLEPPRPHRARQHQRTFHLIPGVTGACLDWLAEVLGSQVPAQSRSELQLVLEEVITNIFKYSSLGEHDEVSVTLAIDDGEVRLTVRDAGIPFNPLEDGRRATLGADIDHAEIGGLGVHLIVQLTDWQRYCRDGNENCLELGRSLTTEKDRTGHR
ncbi:SpoIIE family protein phosphatase [Parahaliea mediterranea]|uniref:SpoIIE family protein phosphatase n=1 Tax=Parahaliea mediterranea TaxID=651086 RepID=UPI000E2F7098|nr:SpoIIE family protein phosphatase [Parahaliea mediterranea]